MAAHRYVQERIDLWAQAVKETEPGDAPERYVELLRDEGEMSPDCPPAVIYPIDLTYETTEFQERDYS